MQYLSGSDSTHRCIKTTLAAKETISKGQADYSPSSSSYARDEPIRNQAITSDQTEDIPRDRFQPFNQREASSSRDSIAPTSDTATSSNSSRKDFSTSSCWKSLITHWDSIIGSLTFVLVLIGVILSGVSMTRSTIASQKSDVSFRLTQWRNCIDLSVSRAILRISISHRRTDM